YDAGNAYQAAEIYFDEAIYRNSETFRVALLMQNLIKAKGTPDFDGLKERYVNHLKGLYKDYDAALDQEVSLALIELYKKNVPGEFLPDNAIHINASTFENSVLTGKQKINGVSILDDTAKAFEDNNALLEVLENDPLVQEIGMIQK